MSFDLVGNRRWFFRVSGVVVLVSLILLAIPPTLRPGIEFTSGTTTLLRFEAAVTQTALRDAYADLGHEEARIQTTGPNEFLIRTSELQIPPGSLLEIVPEPDAAAVGPTPVPTLGTTVLGVEGAVGEIALLSAVIAAGSCELGTMEITTAAAGTTVTVLERHEECGEAGTVLRVALGSVTGYIAESETSSFAPPAEPEPVEPVAQEQGERTVIEEALRSRFGDFLVLEFASVSAVVSKVAVRNASIAVVVASVFILIYVWFAFSSVPRPFVYAACAIFALAHDVVIVLGAFSLFGKVMGTEINLMFVTGLLTVIGFSVHDSIVVFDRVRENVSLRPDEPLAVNVNAALMQTLTRSLNTSATLLLTVMALLLLGGVTIQSFLLVILVGVIAGTYSSIGIAAQLLVAFDERDLPRLWARLRRRRDEPAPAA